MASRDLKFKLILICDSVIGSIDALPRRSDLESGSKGKHCALVAPHYSYATTMSFSMLKALEWKRLPLDPFLNDHCLQDRHYNYAKRRQILPFHTCSRVNMEFHPKPPQMSASLPISLVAYMRQPNARSRPISFGLCHSDYEITRPTSTVSAGVVHSALRHLPEYQYSYCDHSSHSSSSGSALSASYRQDFGLYPDGP